MEDKTGSFVIAADGTLTPNADDEAMAERHGLKKAAMQTSSSDDVRIKKNSQKGGE